MFLCELLPEGINAKIKQVPFSKVVRVKFLEIYEIYNVNY